MGLFSKEACTFCGKEVGAMHRSKLATKEYICSDCRKKLNAFARMDYTSRDAALRMMETLPAQAAAYEEGVEKLQQNSRFDQGRNWHEFDLGGKRVNYRASVQLGAFQLLNSEAEHAETVPTFYFDHMIPYEFAPEGDTFFDNRRGDIMNVNAEYVTVEETKDMDDKVTGYSVVIPYNDECIREIRLKGDVSDKVQRKGFQVLADAINRDRRAWLENGINTERRNNEMQLRNLGDTAAAALKAAVKGEDVGEVIKEGVQTANDIEEGKVRRGLFGKLFKK